MSLNTMTVKGCSLNEALRLAEAHSIPAIAPWRDIVHDVGVSSAAAAIRAAGLHVSSLCRGGMFTHPTPEGRQAALQDNYRAVDEAAELAADCLVLVCGPIVNQDPRGSLAMIRDGLADLAHYAEQAGVMLAAEPLHPMMASSRSALCTLAQTREIIMAVDSPMVGACIDVYHLWWDASALTEVDTATYPLLAFHVSDWITPIEGELSSRGMMGDGHIDLPSWARHMAAAGYEGFVEVELLSDDWWARGPEVTVETAVMRFQEI